MSDERTTEIAPGYYWFRHRKDGSTFIALYAEDANDWFMPALGQPITNVMKHATLLGAVPRMVVGGGSIDQ